MVKLINGRGQLGKELSRFILIEKDSWVVGDDCDCIVYHTWNIDDSSVSVQEKEYCKFVDFVNSNLSKNIFFISTKQGQQINYLYYKLKAELYLLENTKNGQIIRIPKLVGKGLCTDFRDNKILPFDELDEIMTPKDAAIKIMNILGSDKKMNIITGVSLNKRIIYELIQFGVGK